MPLMHPKITKVDVKSKAQIGKHIELQKKGTRGTSILLQY